MHQPSPALAELFARPDADRKLGPFRLERQLGRGGFAPVWLASEVYDGIVLRPAAVKVFAVEGGAASRYREHVVREARSLCQVEHPNIVRFYSLLIEEKSSLIGLAMEYLGGDSLADRLRDRGALPVSEVIDVGIAVAMALDAAHRTGIVHRDVKPANVMVTERGNYKLIDFGIATADEVEAERAPRPRIKRVLVGDLPLEILGTKLSMVADAHTLYGDDSTAAGGIIASGTVGYIDPVCVSSGAAATPASDLYSLGSLLFECLTGKLPAVVATDRPGLRAEVLDGREAPPSVASVVPDAPEVLSQLLTRLLSPERELRPATADDVVAELRALRGGASVAPRASTPSAAESAATVLASPTPSEVARASEPVSAETGPTEGRGSRKSTVWVVAGGVALAAGLAVFATRGGASTPSSENAASAKVVAATPEPTHSTAPSPSAAAASVTGTVEVRPNDAVVTIAGKPAERNAQGLVVLRGEPGTMFDVTAKVAGKAVTQRVALLRDGRTEPTIVDVSGKATTKGGAATPGKPGTAGTESHAGATAATAAMPPTTKSTELKPKDDF